MSFLVFFARATLLLVFVAAVFGKLHSRESWSSFVAATGNLLDVHRGQQVAAVATVIVEAVTAICLSISRTVDAGLAASLAVLAVFLIVVASGVNRRVRTACNCFGSHGTTLGREHVWRNIALVALAAFGTAAAATTSSSSAVALASNVIPAVLSVIVASIFVMWDDFTDLVRGPR